MDSSLARTSKSLIHHLPFLLVLLFASSFSIAGRNYGWMGLDEGHLGQTAERILHGERPHIDFFEPYTGWLSYLNAALFQTFGIDSSSLRLQMPVLGLLICALSYQSALSLGAAPLTAAAASFLSFALSIPQYTVPMPSWHVTTCALIAFNLLLKFLKSPKIWLIVLAAFVAGVAVQIKITGVFIFGALVMTLYVDSLINRANSSRFLALALSISLFIPGFFAFCLIRPMLSISSIFFFLIPFLCLGSVGYSVAFKRLGKDVSTNFIPALLGSILGFVTPFIWLPLAYSWTELSTVVLPGVFLQPGSRYHFASLPMPDPVFYLLTIPFLIIFYIREFGPSWREKRNDRWLIISILLFAEILIVGGVDYLNTAVWLMSPFLLLIYSRSLIRYQDRGSFITRYALLTFSTFLYLTLFPFSSATYFDYVAPFTILIAADLMGGFSTRIGKYWICVSVLLAICLLGRGAFVRGTILPEHRHWENLGIKRVGLVVPDYHARMYRRVIRFVQTHSKAGDPILAFPDGPEVYFFSDRENPTRNIYEFLGSPSGKWLGRYLAIASSGKVDLVVLKRTTYYTPVPLLKDSRKLKQIFSRNRTVGDFKIYWNQRNRKPIV